MQPQFGLDAILIVLLHLLGGVLLSSVIFQPSLMSLKFIDSFNCDKRKWKWLSQNFIYLSVEFLDFRVAKV